ncbi:galactose-specific lectin nattectin-like [Crassostrea angulata]|uniref:galactose-specific lectin nattectin-like n=1 Tax=Magallana angulata TaxID=2784310 RepID=UPI0022B1004B|nr:galactose-specific lectin nattectin-like [Crassostrea angulata]
MRFLEFCIFSALLALVLHSMASDAAHSEDDVLMKRISDLHFKLFSSMKKKTKTMKAAVFETQCCASGCTFNSYKAGVPRVCNGQLLTQLNEIQSSINNIWKKKPIACKHGWKRYGDHCYHLFRAKMNWFEAQIFCRKQGASLIQINNAGENRWLTKNFPNVPYWIDFTDNGTEGKWVTLSTGRSEYTSWDRGQPDNWRGNQNCAYNNFRKRAGRWDDGGCKAKFQAMCEASGSEF